MPRPHRASLLDSLGPRVHQAASHLGFSRSPCAGLRTKELLPVSPPESAPFPDGAGDTAAACSIGSRSLRFVPLRRPTPPHPRTVASPGPGPACPRPLAARPHRASSTGATARISVRYHPTSSSNSASRGFSRKGRKRGEILTAADIVANCSLVGTADSVVVYKTN